MVNVDCLASINYHHNNDKINDTAVLYQIYGLTAKTKSNDDIIRDVCWHISSDAQGSVHAIIGPRGCGKSTLLNVIANDMHNNNNEWKYNDLSFHCDFKYKSPSLDGRTGYLPADSRLLGPLTVCEFLLSRSQQSHISTPSKSKEYHYARVFRVLDELKISHLAGRVIGNAMLHNSEHAGLSGGERKRVAIASELLFDPKCLILDEPTSGLDTVVAFKLIKLLKDIAKSRNILILLSLHHLSPCILKTGYISTLYVMKDGKINASIKAKHIFNNDIEDDEFNMEDLYQVQTPTNQPTGNVERRQIHHKASTFGLPVGFVPFAKRHLLLRWRIVNSKWVWSGRLAVLILAMMCFWNTLNLNSTYNWYDHKGLLFMILMHMQYETLYLCQGNLLEERMVYRDELLRGSISAFTLTFGRVPGELAMNCLNFTPITLMTLLSGCSFQDMASIDFGVKFIIYLLFCLVFSSMWKCVGMWLRDFRRMTWIGDLYVNITMQVSGFWVAISVIKPSGEWIKYVSAISQAFNALTITTLSDRIYIDSADNVTQVSGDQMLINDGIDMPLWLNLIILTCLFILFETIAWAGAKYGRVYHHN